tara:strand:- start:86 stop:223 length:138 start_codon:yes stop_codon:yes gene_type:complete
MLLLFKYIKLLENKNIAREISIPFFEKKRDKKLIETDINIELVSV